MKDNQTICCVCNKICDDNKETKWDHNGDGYCKKCFKEKENN